jgi:hypothetical protein
VKPSAGLLIFIFVDDETRAELISRIARYRNLARLTPDPETAARIHELAAEMERKLVDPPTTTPEV